jgi:hypothetical protein
MQPKFQNRSLTNNPYLNPKEKPPQVKSKTKSDLEDMRWHLNKIKREVEESGARKRRNLSILSRNLRNLAYLRSPNPIPEGKAISADLDLSMFENFRPQYKKKNTNMILRCLDQNSIFSLPLSLTSAGAMI